MEVPMEAPVNASPTKLDAPKAMRAARALLADPDDLPQVFTLLEAMSGGTLARIQRRLGKSVSGRRLLGAKPDIVRLLDDRDGLRKLPEGSLGRAYLAFVESEGISARGIKDAAEQGLTGANLTTQDEEFVHARMRDTHDLWHAITGYKGDVLGEIALLAFTFAQTKNPGIFLIVTLGLYKTLGAPDARAVILEGWRRGQRAAWFPEQEWEAMLALPVAEVRAKLGVGAPPLYTPVRSAELRARAAA
jgi:ubiquinone biosynthesis protein COQ4